MSDYWFKPKSHGYGATPTNWKGWVAVAGYMAAVLALTLPLIVWPAEMPVGPKIWQLVTWAILVAALTLGFVRFTRTKTDGQWAWRWGK
jgi:NhaP-type Na+/H+ or K+/H+ antiporter